MKKFIILILFIAALVAFFDYRHGARLSVTSSTPRAVKAQADLKFNSFAASMEEGHPQAVGKIDLLSFTDPTFHRELMQLHQRFVGFLELYEREHGVTLTPKQQYQIARAMAVARLSQTLYEAEIASVDNSNPSSVKISIPAYADQGDIIRDFLVDKITKNTGNPALAQALAGDMGRNFDRYGAYVQNMTLTQKPESLNGQPVTAVAIFNSTMAAPGIPMTSGSNFPRGDMQDFTPFEAFLK